MNSSLHACLLIVDCEVSLLSSSSSHSLDTRIFAANSTNVTDETVSHIRAHDHRSSRTLVPFAGFLLVLPRIVIARLLSPIDVLVAFHLRACNDDEERQGVRVACSGILVGENNHQSSPEEQQKQIAVAIVHVSFARLATKTACTTTTTTTSPHRSSWNETITMPTWLTLAAAPSPHRVILDGRSLDDRPFAVTIPLRRRSPIASRKPTRRLSYSTRTTTMVGTKHLK